MRTRTWLGRRAYVPPWRDGDPQARRAPDKKERAASTIPDNHVHSDVSLLRLPSCRTGGSNDPGRSRVEINSLSNGGFCTAAITRGKPKLAKVSDFCCDELQVIAGAHGDVSETVEENSWIDGGPQRDADRYDIPPRPSFPGADRAQARYRARERQSWALGERHRQQEILRGLEASRSSSTT